MELPEVASGEKYNLKWNKHHDIIASNIFDHLSGEELVDITLSCEGKFIKAHKLILSASSQYFKELFQRHKGENPIIIMTNIRFDCLKYIIDYIYKGEIKLLSSEIPSILSLANELQIRGLYGILNKSFQHLTDVKHDSNIPSKNNKNAESDDKANAESKKHGAAISNINITAHNDAQNRIKNDDSKAEKKRGGERMKQSRTKKRKTIPVEHEIDLSGAFRPISPNSSISLENSMKIEAQNSLMHARDLQESPLQETTPAFHHIVAPLINPDPQEPLELLSQESKRNITTDCAINPSESLKVSPKRVASPIYSSFGEHQELETTMKIELDTIQYDTRAESPKSQDGIRNKSVAVKQISAFMLFTEQYRPIISSEYPEESVKQISLRLSSMWKNLPIERKDSYYEEASRENEKVKRKMMITNV